MRILSALVTVPYKELITYFICFNKRGIQYGSICPDLKPCQAQSVDFGSWSASV